MTTVTNNTVTQPVAPVENKTNYKTIAAIVASVVGGLALAALATFAYMKGYLQPVIQNAGYVFQIVANWATKSPLNATALVVGTVGLVALGIFLVKLTYDAISKSCCTKSAAVKDEAAGPAKEEAAKPANAEIDINVNIQKPQEAA